MSTSSIVLPDDGNVGSVDIERCRKGELFRMKSRGSNYSVSVISPDRCDVAITTDSKYLHQAPSLWRVLGSGLHGSIIGPHEMRVGDRLYMRIFSDIAGNMVETSAIIGITPVKDDTEAARLIKQAENDFAESVGKIIADEFPVDKSIWVAETISLFGNPAGISEVLRALSSARKNGKLQDAMSLLERDWENTWENQHRSNAGDPDYDGNLKVWEVFYRRLGMSRIG